MEMIQEVLERGIDRLPGLFACCLGMADERASRPFEIEGFVYATNGRICVRTPTPAGWDVPNPERPIATAPEVFRGPFQPDPVALPALQPRPCPYCEGARFRGVTPCPECDEGDVEAPCDCPKCDGSHPCTNCDGKGNIAAGPCRHCMRSGVSGRMEGVEIAPRVWVAERYLMLLVAHHALAYLPADPSPSAYGLTGDQFGPLIRLVAGAVEGRVMPMDARVCEYDRDEARRMAAASR